MADLSKSDVTATNDAKEAAERFDFVRFTFADINGLARCRSVPRRNFSEFFDDGMQIFCGIMALGTCGELVKTAEVKQNTFGNMAIKPMPGTLHSLPWAADGKYRVGEVLCESFWLPPFKGGGPQDVCPRYVARRQLDRLEQLGYRLYSGYEAEFMILCGATGRPLYEKQDVFLNLRFAEYESFLYSLDEKMAAAGIDVLSYQTEYAGAQFEAVMAPKFGIESSDQMFLLKEAVKEFAQQHKDGWKATFMSKPFAETIGNGLHYSHSLWTIPSSSGTSTNVFYSSKSDDMLSDVAHHWVAGLLKHGRALNALCSPTVNCYRRLHTSWAPDSANWGIEDRMATIRAKVGHPSATYFENRLSGGSANPYLIVAATVAAGIDGLVNKLQCPAPMSESSEKLPSSLSEAIKALEEDHVLCEALGETFVRWFGKMKRQNEIEVFDKMAGGAETEITKKEWEMYL